MDPRSNRSAPTGSDADDPTLLPLPGPAGAAPRRPAPLVSPPDTWPDGAGSDDATLLPAPGAARAFRNPLPASAPAAGDDDRTLYGPADAAAPDEAATVFVPAADVEPWLRMPAPGAGATPVSRPATDGEPTLLAVPGADTDGTVLRMPAPGGQATAVQSGPLPTAAPTRTPRGGVELQRLVAGVNPLLGAASVLLALVAQLRASGTHADPDALREQLLAHMADFEAQAAASGVARPRVTAARYLLCSFLDEAIAATPWGQGCWEARTLLGEFHEERWGGDKAFELLEKLGEDPAANAEVLELFYVCLALGFEGRYRGQPDARARLDAIAERVLRSVRPAAAAAQPADGVRSLSLRWQGVSAPQRPGLHLPPLWSVAVLAGALVLAALLAFQWRLAAQAQPLLRELHALPAALQPARAAAGADAPASVARLAPLLQADAAAGALAVRDERLRSVVTLPADALFKGGTELRPGAAALLGRVAQALRALPGQVNVIGHSDDVSAASLQFPSNWHLSRSRAQAVLDELARQGLPALRLHAEGRADAEPLAPGHAAEDRARNRRVEIELRLPRPQAAESGGKPP